MKILLFKFLGIFTNLFDKLLKKTEPTIKPMRPQFYFGPNGTPYHVDWLGTKDQIDAAKAAGIDHVVLLSSMGGMFLLTNLYMHSLTYSLTHY